MIIIKFCFFRIEFQNKLLEIIILQCHQSIENVIPSFLELMFQHLSKEVKNTEVKTMCIQVVVAALWCNTDIVLRTLDNVTLSQNTGESVLLKFLQQWLGDIDAFQG